MQATLLVALGGAVGSVARYWMGLLLLPISRDLPWGTILVNILGSFIISLFGVLTIASGRFAIPEIWRLTFMVGVCGGFTTFSSFSLQTLELLRMGQPGKALLNIGLSVALCLIAVWLGFVTAERINSAQTKNQQTTMQNGTSEG